MEDSINKFTSSEGKIEIASVVDFWRFHFSNEWALMSEISEFLVAKALGIDTPTNKKYWTLYDIDYNGLRVEVKETAYCHSWKHEASTALRVFGIEKSYGYKKRESQNYKRYSDVYIFCFNTIIDQERFSPLDADTCFFYVIKTSIIDKIFGNQKKVSIGRIEKLVKAGYAIKCTYSEIKNTIDNLFT